MVMLPQKIVVENMIAHVPVYFQLF